MIRFSIFSIFHDIHFEPDFDRINLNLFKAHRSKAALSNFPVFSDHAIIALRKIHWFWMKISIPGRQRVNLFYFWYPKINELLCSILALLTSKYSLRNFYLSSRNQTSFSKVFFSNSQSGLRFWFGLPQVKFFS